MSVLMDLLAEIKKKKELSGLSDEFVSEILNKHIRNIKLDLLKSTEKKLLVKEVRADLRRTSGMFQKSFRNRKSFLEKEDIASLLKTHSSTSERLEIYPELKELIHSLKPLSILDLGCGLNPLALASKEVIYYAVDIRGDELDLIDSFFRKNKFRGKVFLQDLRKPIDNLPSADLCLILKLLDLLSRKQAENLMKNVSCRKIIISFSTKTLSGKKMRISRRLWFEQLLSKLNYSFSTRQSGNEVFYIVEK